jgi:hypothetical protein
VKELHYHLMTLVNACRASDELFSRSERVPDQNGRAVLCSFSAFVNAMLSLKDTASTVTGSDLPWSAIEELRHGGFMRLARHAATHDGHPIINAWVDGRYFIASKIVRIDNRGDLIEIPAPGEDVETLCLEFTFDFCHLLTKALAASLAAPELSGGVLTIEAVEECLKEVSVVPEFAKQLLASNRDQIAAALRNVSHDPVAEALKVLNETADFCAVHLKK